MRIFMRNERGKIDALLGLVIVVIAVGFAIYQFWIKEDITQPESAHSRPKNVIDGVRTKVNDAMEKEKSRLPAEESDPPSRQ